MKGMFFSHKECEAYPCHGLEEINCLFCYCPLYEMDCPGTPKLLKNGKRDCSECDYPHKKENAEEIVEILKNAP